MSSPKRLTKQVIWRRKSMKTANPANREKVWTAGITDRAPTGTEKALCHSTQQRTLCKSRSCGHKNTRGQIGLTHKRYATKSVWLPHQNGEERRLTAPSFSERCQQQTSWGVDSWSQALSYLIKTQLVTSTPTLMYLTGFQANLCVLHNLRTMRNKAIFWSNLYVSLWGRNCIFHLLLFQQYLSPREVTIKGNLQSNEGVPSQRYQGKTQR